MNRVWKWTLQLRDRQTVELPKGAEILSVQMQGDWPQLWALCNPDEGREPREIAIVGTGHAVDEGPRRYINTFQMHAGELVFHVFELPRAR